MRATILKKLIPAWGAWGVLGFYRGIRDYNNYIEEKYNEYESKKPEHKQFYTKPQFFFLDCIMFGTFGAAYYAAPPFMPITFYKELHNLEANMRSLEKEKNQRFTSLI